MNFFSKKPTPKEALRESKREMANATRGIEREINALQLEEKKLVTEIKRTAKTGNEAATKILARQLVRLRQQIANLQGSRAQMRGIATHTQTEMMSDAIDDALDNDEAEDETEELTNQVLDEIGVDIASQLSAAPKGKIAGKNTEDVGSSGIDELEKRMAALRNP
ncbi:Vacuolar protein sorting-associated protein [Abeliophyllum distichum]|uniref:Vacuolar protein sorting-associated protein n=1 Tax=Abeliophyllum distichum TaxID=126358 RepID=A0ABD1VTG6_9LAMI